LGGSVKFMWGADHIFGLDLQYWEATVQRQ
jgi:hypothetical protein